MIGIPLGIFMFQSIGERLNKLISIVIGHFKAICKFKKTEATEFDLMAVTGFLSSLITVAGAAVFSRYEGWSYLDSFYYCFVTLTTIGFGDFVALQNDRALTSKPGYVAFSLVFILFGLAVVAGCMNLLVLRFMTMNAEDLKRDDGDVASYRGGLSLDGDTNNFTNGFSVANKLSAASEIKGPGTFDSDQVSVCSCTGCSCFGNRAVNLFGFNDDNYSAGRGSRKNSWAAQIHVQEKHRIWRAYNWRRRSSSINRSGSRLSRLTFGIDSVCGQQDVRNMPPPTRHRDFNDVYNNFKGDFCFNGRDKRASI